MEENIVFNSVQKVSIKVQSDWYCFGVTPNFTLNA